MVPKIGLKSILPLVDILLNFIKRYYCIGVMRYFIS